MWFRADAVSRTSHTELRPDLIVLDYKMHHTDGLTAADRILRAMPEIPIVNTLLSTIESELNSALV